MDLENDAVLVALDSRLDDALRILQPTAHSERPRILLRAEGDALLRVATEEALAARSLHYLRDILSAARRTVGDVADDRRRHPQVVMNDVRLLRDQTALSEDVADLARRSLLRADRLLEAWVIAARATSTGDLAIVEKRFEVHLRALATASAAVEAIAPMLSDASRLARRTLAAQVAAELARRPPHGPVVEPAVRSTSASLGVRR